MTLLRCVKQRSDFHQARATAQEGIVLPLILLGLAVGSVIVIGLLSLTGTAVRIGGEDVDQVLSLYAAEAGVATVSSDLIQGVDALSPGYTVSTSSINGYEVAVSVTAPPASTKPAAVHQYIDPGAGFGLSSLPGQTPYYFRIDNVQAQKPVRANWAFTPARQRWTMRLYEGEGPPGAAAPVAIASDGFESGAFGGGSGWLADWGVVGAASVTSEDNPLEGAYHLRLISTTGGGSLFAFRGDNTNGFWRYRPGTDTWTLLANAPATVNGGGSLAWDEGDYIYALRGENRRDFWRYTISADTWETLDDTPGRVDDGGALIYTDGLLYALSGYDSRDFWRYLPGSDTWTPLADAPGAVNAGGSLAWDEADYIHALRGDDKRDFWRYAISADTWELLDDTSQRVNDGGALTHADGLLYAFRGDRRRDFWRYDIDAGGWLSRTDTPDNVAWGGGPRLGQGRHHLRPLW